MSCPACKSPKPELHPCKKDGQPLPDYFISLEHTHYHTSEKPLTIVVCNNAYHEVKGRLVQAKCAEAVLVTPPPQLSEPVETLLTYLSEMTKAIEGLDEPSRLRIFASDIVVSRIDGLTQAAWGEKK